jgi:hypothetical protein
VLYPPSDWVSITIPAEASPPGCGREHGRPAGPDGFPLHPFGLSCGPCEAWLREHDTRWVPTISEIVPTFDERKEREHLALHAGSDRDDVMMRALAKIAGVDIPASLARPVSAAAVPAMVACPSGHAQASGMAFCGHCGAPMRRAVPAAEIATPAAASS